jgi:cyclic beta-1,2-glucan synthetase
MPNTAPRPGKAEPATTPRQQHTELALELAQQLASCAPRRGEFPIPDQLKNFMEFFQSAYQYFDEATKTEVSVSHAAEWLLDNFYVLEQALRHVEEDLPAAYYDRLPKTEDGGLRIYILVLAIMQQNNARFDIEQIKNFIQKFQSVTPLSTGELWALPMILRLTAMEALAEGLATITKLKWDTAPRPALWKKITAADSSDGILEQVSPQTTAETLVVNSILNLRMLATQDWKAFFESTSVLEKILRDDPAEVYAQMDFETRNHYRGVVEELARGSSVTESNIASQVIQLAQAGASARKQHVGYYLIGPGAIKLEGQISYRPQLYNYVTRLMQKHATGFYLVSIAALTILFTSLLVSYAARAGGNIAQIFLAAILVVLPASAAAIGIVNWLVVSIIPPRTLPKLDFQTGVPSEFRTMVVIPALLGTDRDAPFLIRQIEHHFLANTDPNIFFALITDFADAPEKKMPGDDQTVARARTAIEQLNKKYGRRGYRPFYLFHRERLWNPGEDCWMGRERKRGKLEEFNHLLRGDTSTTFIIKIGNLNILPSIRYVITLDADTVLPRESAQRLIGTLAHPLNQAEFDAASEEITDGYTVLQPRAQVKPAVANQSVFTRVYSGDSAIDLYTRAVSDTYQDLFGEGNYVGKGIYDVDAFQKSLKDRVPENRLLSHDLFEGVHGRCGLVTDVVLFEDYPPHYLTYTDRLHRWVRGDWQLLPWLASQVPHRTKGKVPNPLSVIDRWKLIDNLRRSLLPPMVLVMLVGGWLFLPGSSLAWMLFALSPYLISIVTNVIAEIHRVFSRKPASVTTHPLRLAALRALFEIIFLPHESLIILDAIGTTLLRMFVLHKGMLEWVTAAHTVRVFGRTLKVRAAWQAMVIAPSFAIALTLLMLSFYPETLLTAAPLLVGWIVAPYIAARISRPDPHIVKKLSPAQERKLHLLARSTWLYFEHFVGPEDRWLPPDHFQENPRGLVAHHTSPTNIGLMLLSTLSAHDLGYIGPLEFSLRIRDSFDSMDSLERIRGHFLNWYDTRTFAPLPPRYISTVDSGNLAACLLVLRQGCREMAQSPVVHWEGLLDTINLLLHTLAQANPGNAGNKLHAAIDSLRDQVEILCDASQFSPTLLMKLFGDSQAELENMLWEAIQTSDEEMTPEAMHSLSIWINRLRYQLRHVRIDLQVLSPWLLALSNMPPLFQQPDIKPELASALAELKKTLSLHPLLGEIPDISTRAGSILKQIIDLLDESNQTALDWCNSLAYDLESARNNSASLLEDYFALASRAESYFQAMNFNFLFDTQRRVFHIGYNVESGRLDSNYYDLLASEARIASLIAIARGDVSQSHWLYLARPLTEVNGMRSLLSWSGTMFEYLMPTLFAESYPNTLLNQSCQAAVEEQIRYGTENGIPWGTSEASYYAFDAAQVYQYRAFGVPTLGYKRGLAEDLVVAPYASILALPFAPQAVMQDLGAFEKLKMWALYGLYESVDFTPERLKTGEHYAIIRSFMVHHQGMVLMSLNNYLFNKRMVRRFHADPRIESIELLLQEQIPADAPTEHPRPQPMDSMRGTYTSISLEPWRVSPNAPYIQVHCLSNGKYSLLITAAGSGFSRWGDIELTRWRADSTLDNWGSWIYVEDRLNGKLWSAMHEPSMIPPDRSEGRFFPHRVEFERQNGDIVLRTSVNVAPDDNVEIRRVSVINNGNSSRVFALTSYAEIILAPQTVDQHHPAFNKLFIESEFLPKEQVLLFRRRPRAANEKAIYLAHFFISDDEDINLTGYETDRARFLGRGGTPERPVVFSTADASRLSGTTGATLDPICALQAEMTLPAYQTTQVAFITLAANSRKEALDVARRYRRWSHLRRVRDDARAHSERELAQLDLTSQKVELIQKLLSPLLYPSPAMRAEPAVLATNTLGQPGLWPFAISGDYPILLVRLQREENLGLLNELLLAHTYWRKRGLMIDLVIFNQHETSYEQDFQSKVSRLLSRTGGDTRLNKRGGIFIVDEDKMNQAERILLTTVARVILDGEAGSLEQQLSKLDANPARLPRFVSMDSLTPQIDSLPETQKPTDLLFDNGLGGFTPDGREYVIHLQANQWTPAPWINVIATSEFGCLVSESGMGSTWAKNSGENRLTPWRNDVVSDTPSEAIYLRDEETGQVWSPTPLPARADTPYLIRHGAGYSTFEHASHGLEQNVRIFVVPDEPVKIVQLTLHNATDRTRRINATYYAEWVLGTTRENTSAYIVPEFVSGYFALLARNTYSTDFGQRVAFLASTREPNGVTTDRTEFLGNHGSYLRPSALERVGLTPSVHAGGDPCAVLQLLLWLQPGETKEVTFLLGQGADRADTERLISHYHNIQNVEAAWQAVGEFWDEILEQTQVQTPDPSMDLLLNRWLLYQALSCRFWGRTAFYQSSGAYGFRDQLQDSMGLIHVLPELVREHILDAASHQFEEGDVLHWWHPPGGRGIHTRCSDNLLWLPYVTAFYVHITGDRSILARKIPFLSAEPLKANEHERYGQFPSGQSATLYEHCCRAIAKGTTAGPHGIPLMGAHDWNDGMNRVGLNGQGESIWLGWFLSATLINFADVCDSLSDHTRADGYRAQANEIFKAVELGGWDGEWYRRAYYDDGSPLGSAENNECRIDSIAQSWGVISGGADPLHASQAMESVYKNLVRSDDNLILLFTPPFDRTARDPGYIKGYPPGIRENGGQYTHAALWAIWAFAQMGEGERTAELFSMINPIHHADTAEKANRYRVEPYVVAADVYSMPPHTGRGGWTWYTGSASWMYRLGTEMMLGLRRSGDHLQIKPCIPKDWPEYQLNYRFGKTMYHIRVENKPNSRLKTNQVLMDGESLKDENIPLLDDNKTHEVLITLAAHDPVE